MAGLLELERPTGWVDTLPEIQEGTRCEGDQHLNHDVVEARI